MITGVVAQWLDVRKQIWRAYTSTVSLHLLLLIEELYLSPYLCISGSSFEPLLYQIQIGAASMKQSKTGGWWNWDLKRSEEIQIFPPRWTRWGVSGGCSLSLFQRGSSSTCFSSRCNLRAVIVGWCQWDNGGGVYLSVPTAMALSGLSLH